MSKTTWLMVFIALNFFMAATPVLSQPSEDDKLNLFFKSYLEEHFQQQPLAATRLGDHRFDHLLDDISGHARDGWLAFAQRTLAELPQRVDYKKLSRDGQIDFEIFQHHLQAEIWEAKNSHPFQEDPRTYGGYINDGVYLLLTHSTLAKETNIANCIARMAQIPRIVAEAEKSLTHPPKPVLETAIRQNLGSINFYEKEIFKLAGDTPQLDALKSAAAPVVAALKNHQKFLEGPLRSRANGEWRVGKRKFDQKFRLMTEAGITAEENLAAAEREFALTRRDLYVIARQLWSQYFPQKVLPPDDAAGERETTLKVIEAVNQDHGRPEDLISDARATVDHIKTFINRKNYLRLPDPDRCDVIKMPEFRRGNAVAYLDGAPPLDANARSYYAISPPPADWSAQQVNSFLEEYNRSMLQVLTLHEAYPGHYVQLAYAVRTPSLIRRVFQSGVYVEGWAVYGEMAMLNEGYGDGDLRLRLMQLKFYLRAVANAILDYKLHCTQMSDDEAMKFLTEDAFQSAGETRLKVIRAKQSSVQLSTYFVGRMAHFRLRQQIERELGDKFALADYHQAVLQHGSIPVKYLSELIRSDLGMPRQ